MKRLRLVLAALASVASLAATAAAVSTTAHATTVYPFQLATSYTITGNLAVGNVATLNLTLTNTSTVDDPYGGFGWMLLPTTIKRTNTPVGGNPMVLCEAYRGHQGGLTQAVYDDFSHVWVTGPIPASGSITLAFPVKLLVEGDTDTVTEMSWGEPGPRRATTRTSSTSHARSTSTRRRRRSAAAAVAAVPRVAAAALPDLQTSVKASTSSRGRAPGSTSSSRRRTWARPTCPSYSSSVRCRPGSCSRPRRPSTVPCAPPPPKRHDRQHDGELHGDCPRRSAPPVACRSS